MPAKIEMINKKFNMLTVLEKDEQRSSKKSLYWICQCDCGNIKSIRGTSLRAGEIKSCGCLQKQTASIIGKANIKNLLGQRFGKLIVIQQVDSKNNRAQWLCKCDCGNTKIVSSTNLIEHRVQSCGCINYSLGERNIEKCLLDNNILFKKQFCFPDLPKRYFDFAIFDDNNNLIELIEFDGPQHYDSSYNWYSQEQVKRDGEKNEYCLKHKIKLIRIKYNDRDQINLKLLELKEK